LGLRVLLPLSLALAASSAFAQKPPAAELNDLVVVAPKDPKVTSAFPSDGAHIPGGTAVLKIVFDQPMTPSAWSYSPSSEGKFPECLKRPRLLNDRKTFVLLCSLPTNTAFAVAVNAAPDFVSTARKAAPPFVLRFSTTSDVTVAMHDALTQAGLGDQDDPIMGWDPAQGAVQAPPPPRPTEPPS
jgi:hypothetical protein